MINYVRLERFKCFLDETIPIAPLTILAGANNTGKSSVIQSLLLLKQTVQTSGIKNSEKANNTKKTVKKGDSVVEFDIIIPSSGSTHQTIYLQPEQWTISINGPLIHIGNAWDIFCQNSGADDITISLGIREHPDKILKLKLLYDVKNSETHHMKTENNEDFALLHDLLSEIRFTHIGAMRTGPQLLFPTSNELTWSMSVGNMGQYTVHCLHQFGKDKIAIDKLVYEGAKSKTLSYQTEQYMNYLIPGIIFQYKKISEADYFTMGIRDYEQNTEYFRPTNVGFGITYCLPIVVAALMSRAGDVLICENPESHLHPEAQSRLGMFLSRVADAGIQVILETHSDHIFNGVRLAVKNGVINKSAVAINSFDRSHAVSNPVIDQNGRMDLWPKGFFDQIEIDLMELL
ncbi:MAG: DUF3696 domain-containing protein [Candidatus Magnetominusculus sp. LBB02]|nr:DUF3696 domain-containing protein [Candidatus Magnetominusculus sp. LBB02]